MLDNGELHEGNAALGRLTALGVDQNHPHRALLIAPNRYEDLRECLTSLSQVDLSETRQTLINGYISSPPRYDPIKKRTTFQVRLARSAEHVRIMSHRQPQALPQPWKQINNQVHLYGKLSVGRNGMAMMFSPRAVDPVSVGRAIGVYPQKKSVISSELARERITGFITPGKMRELIEDLKQQLAPYRLSALLKSWADLHGQPSVAAANLAKIIYRMHYPVTPQQGELAKRVLADLDALALILEAERERPSIGVIQRVEHSPEMLSKRISDMPLQPTDEQLVAVQEALEDMASGQPMHRLLSGDVGTGKTIVLGLVASAVADAGGTVGIMMPNSDLVQQVASDISSWWPDLGIERVTSNRKRQANEEHSIKIGTTALLHRYGDWRPTLTIVDEQQKYSISQRQQLARDGGHLLEATATCVPRTAALMNYGFISQSRLKKPHTPKSINTRIFNAGEASDRKELFKGLMGTLEQQGQTLVVFAARDDQEAARVEKGAGAYKEALDKRAGGKAPAKVIPLERGFATWSTAAKPGEVVSLHGQMKAAERKTNLDAIKRGSAKILCATVSAEVGLNIPNLKQIIIYNAERFGLTQLHQLRGRVSRMGGEGRCDLFVDTSYITDSAMARLKALCSTTDGFRLAEMDMELRGIGDLVTKSNRQSGSTSGGILINHKPTLDNLNNAKALIDLMASHAPGPTQSAKPIAEMRAPADRPQRKTFTSSFTP